VKLRENGGQTWLAEAVGNYTINMKCTWVVEAERPDSRIRLHLRDFETECGWDHLYIWDGDNIFTGLQAVYSGLVKTKSGDYQIHTVPEIVGESGTMLLHFYSDVAYNMTGFNISFTVDSCPSKYPSATCSGRGSCDVETGTCDCDNDIKGPACEVLACPDNCGSSSQERRGRCNKDKKMCECEGPWRGEDCSQRVEDGWWEVVDTGDTWKDLVTRAQWGRTSHAAVIDSNDMWVIGGEFLHKAPSDSMVVKRDMISGEWSTVKIRGSRAPSERYGHSVVIHNGKLFMYGGVMRSGHVSKELWSFNIETKEWTREAPKTGRCLGSLCGEIHSAGHTATVVQNRMIVIFGHSPQYGYLDTVQEYHFGNMEWGIIETRGYPVKGGYGHSAVLDEYTNLIYVYGGYISVSSSVAQLSNNLYSFEHQKGEWTLLSESPSYRYLHSATIIRGMMLVFGGNTHNDTQFSQGAKCYSREFLAYDILCDTWSSLDHTIPSVRDFSADLDRFGHTAVSFNDSVYFYGGFNGQTKNDVVRFVPGQCRHVNDRETCISSKHGVKCVWSEKTGTCDTWSSESGKKTSLVKCLKDERNSSAICRSQTSCQSCLGNSDACVWCSDGCHKGDKCPQLKDIKIVKDVAQCLDSEAKEVCSNLHTCDHCDVIDKCVWNSEKQCKERQGLSTGVNDSEESGSKKESKTTCPVSCSARDTCTNCTSAMCMWCQNMQMCIDRNAYLASFPYGQCMDWTTHFEQCPRETNDTVPNLCSGYDTCSSCQNNPACGWCDAGQNNGLGSCHEGGVSGPLQRVSMVTGTRGVPWTWIPSDTCSDSGKEWHFTTCPICQCNGHSVCNKTSPGVCQQPCSDNTQGDHCERCSVGFFGHPVNGGTCKKCECNGQGTECDHRSGNCFCTTKGVTGDHCEKCDTQNHYFGNPMNESCYYDLAIDYQFTFNLSKPEDKHYTAINFKNVPTKADVDVDFSISCSVDAKMNLTYRTGKGGTINKDNVLSEKNCSTFKHRFSKSEYTFGSEDNTTFLVYVYDFKPPLWIIISFSQHPKLDLLQFFITFSTCFLALLLIAAVLWKIKQKYDRYRRRQRLYVEMEQMASRPFGQVLIELERIPDTSSESSHHTRKRRKKSRPSPIALEPCAGNRAAVLSLVVRMPTGGHSFAPPGTPGIAIASSLVTLGNPRKVSVDPTQKLETETNKTRKSRKVVTSRTGQPTDL